VPGSVLVADDHFQELCNYTSYNVNRTCIADYWPSYSSEVTPTMTIHDLFNKLHATVIYADSGMLEDPVFAKFAQNPQAQGWLEKAHGTDADGPWQLYVRST
jgi:hypothetical protein